MSQRKKEKLQKNAGLVNLPTDLTYELRMAVEGYGEKKFLSWGYQWKDKPHRLVYTACAEIEALTVENAKLRAEVEQLRADAERFLWLSAQSDVRFVTADESTWRLIRSKETLADLVDCARKYQGGGR